LRGVSASQGAAALHKDLPNRRAVVHLQSLAAWYFEFVRVQAEQMKDCCVDVSDVMAVAQGVVTQFVRGAVNGPAFDASAGEPDAEAVRVMVAAVLAAAALFEAGRPAE